MAGSKIGCAAWLFDSPPDTVWGRLRSVSPTALKPNQALERTAARRVLTFQMIKTVAVAATLGFPGGRSAWSR